jgi:hypothetical protein
MGYAFAVDDNGRQIGYAVKATCDLDGCVTQIDRGLDYCCGGMPDGGDHGCGGYFCHAHVEYPLVDDVDQLCGTCIERFERAHPEAADA